MHDSMKFTEEHLFKSLRYMNDDLHDLIEKPDLFMLIVQNYIYEARVYLEQFDSKETKDAIEEYINSWNELSKKL